MSGLADALNLSSGWLLLAAVVGIVLGLSLVLAAAKRIASRLIRRVVAGIGWAVLFGGAGAFGLNVALLPVGTFYP